MAKLRDELLKKAENRESGARDMTLRAVKSFSVRIGPMREVKNPQGAVYKMVQTLLCEATVAGVPDPIEYVSEMEAADNYGVFGEIDQSLSPALREFLDAIKTAVTKKIKASAKPLDPEAPLPLPSEQAKDQLKSLSMKQKNAAREVAKAVAAQPPETPAAETPAPAAAPEGGEA